MQIDGCGLVVANAGESGYYRVRYDAATLAELTREHDKLTPAERIGLVRDQWALVRQGSLPLKRFLDLVVAMRGERALPAVVELAGALDYIDDSLVAEADRPRFASLVAQLFLPLFVELGWDPKPGETDVTRLLRAQLLYMLGHTARLPSILSEAEVRLARYLKEPASLDGSVADEVVRLGAQSGTPSAGRIFARAPHRRRRRKCRCAFVTRCRSSKRRRWSAARWS